MSFSVWHEVKRPGSSTPRGTDFLQRADKYRLSSPPFPKCSGLSLFGIFLKCFQNTEWGDWSNLCSCSTGFKYPTILKEDLHTCSLCCFLFPKGKAKSTLVFSWTENEWLECLHHWGQKKRGALVPELATCQDMAIRENLSSGPREASHPAWRAGWTVFMVSAGSMASAVRLGL